MKTKCNCINCGWVQTIEEGETEDCQKCGFAINSNEDKED